MLVLWQIVIQLKAFPQPKEQDAQCVDNLFPLDLLFNHQLLKTTTKMIMKSGSMKVEMDGGNMTKEQMSTLVSHHLQRLFWVIVRHSDDSRIWIHELNFKEFFRGSVQQRRSTDKCAHCWSYVCDQLYWIGSISTKWIFKTKKNQKRKNFKSWKSQRNSWCSG